MHKQFDLLLAYCLLGEARQGDSPVGQYISAVIVQMAGQLLACL